MTLIYSPWEFLYHDEVCKITKRELEKLFPEYKERWDEILEDSNGWRRIEIITVAFACLDEAGISMLVTPTIDGEFPVATKETFKELAQKYDKIVGAVHEFGVCKSDLSENNRFPLAQLYVEDPHADPEASYGFKLKYGTVEEIRESVKELKEDFKERLHREKGSGEYYSLDMAVWEPVKMDRGEHRGMHPVVTSQGNVAVGRNYAGEDVRVFVRK